MPSIALPSCSHSSRFNHEHQVLYSGRFCGEASPAIARWIVPALPTISVAVQILPTQQPPGPASIDQDRNSPLGHRVELANVPTTPQEVETLRHRVAEHANIPRTGLRQHCQISRCSTWEYAAISLWWIGLDNSYATESQRRLKAEIGVSRAGQLPTSLKAPLTFGEADALRRELLIHKMDPDAGSRPYCHTTWCASWVIAASCQQLNGLDETFLHMSEL